MSGIDWLASYPKSGNTWVRCLVAAYITGSVNPNHLPVCVAQSDLRTKDYHAVSPENLVDMHPMSIFALRPAVLEHIQRWPWGLVKTHHARLRIREISLIPTRVSSKAIYLVRDPRDVAKSFAAHLDMDIGELIDLMGQSNATLCKKGMGGMLHALSSWSLHVDSWMKSDFPVLCVKYETLKKRPEDQLTKILEFLGFHVEHEKVERAVQACNVEALKAFEAAEGFREAKNGEFFGRYHEPLTDRQLDRIETDHHDVMAALGYL